MTQKYEYKFVRLGEGWPSVGEEAETSYRDIVAAHATEGWRLVQVFAPGIGRWWQGRAKYYELILERPV